MDNNELGFGSLDPFSPSYSWAGKVASSKRISLRGNENLHYEGTYYLALKELFDHVSAERIARADLEVDDLGESASWYFVRNADIVHHLASKDIDAITTKKEAFQYYQDRLKNSCAALKTRRRSQADEFLGQALHTLQDSFSHSDEHGEPMLSEEHDSSMDHAANNPIKAALALQATESILKRYKKEIDSGETFCASPTCDACTYWDSEVLFNMPKQKGGRRECTRTT